MQENRDSPSSDLSPAPSLGPSSESSSDISIETVENLSKDEIWNNVGFHRPLAGFFYNLPFNFITIIVAVGISGFLYSVLYPFPESIGYKTTATSIFALFFQVFDLGTANIMNRFIGETNISNPKKMVHYLQYFIWYQMFTGLIQITAISSYALFIVPKGELAYAIWIMLLYSTTQYPGMLNIFRSTMETLQQYNKTTVIAFIQSELFQRITEIAFVIWGKNWGAANPEIGALLGIAIGATIGLYVDDFIAMVFSLFFFQKVIKLYGFSVKDCLRHDFDFKLFKECLIWGIKSGIPPMMWTIVSLAQLLLWIQYVPQYTTFAALYAFAGNISGLLNYNLNLGGGISESFMNGKKNLAQYYVGQAWRYAGLIQFLMLSIISLLVAVLQPALLALNLQYYVLSIGFIIPRIVRDFQQPYNNFSSNVITSTGHVNFMMFTQIVEAVLAYISWVIFIPVLKIPQTYGYDAIIWLIPCGELPAIMTKIVLNYVFIHKKIMKLKIPLIQTFISPVLTTIIIYLIGRLYIFLIFDPMVIKYGIIAAIIPFIGLFLFVSPFVIYMPLTGYFGAWDDGTLAILYKATKISGMGKIFAIPIYRMLLWTTKKSKLHNRFSMDDTLALKEARELMVIRNEKIGKDIKII